MKILTRFLVLIVFCIGIGYVLFSPAAQRVVARPCCESCPGSGDPTSAEYVCPSQCADDDDACWQNCINSINNCYGICVDCSLDDPPVDNSTRVACEMYEVYPHHFVEHCWTVTP